MDLRVHSKVAAVYIAVEVLSHEGVVQRGVEDDLIIVRAAFDLYLLEEFIPCRVGLLMHRIEGCSFRIFGAQVGLGVLLTDV